MIDDQTMTAATDKLRAAGLDVPDSPTITEVAHLIELETQRRRPKNTSQSDWISVYARPKVPPRQVPPFRPLVAVPHFRAAEIDAAQPPMMTPCMVGNGSEHSKVWRR